MHSFSKHPTTSESNGDLMPDTTYQEFAGDLARFASTLEREQLKAMVTKCGVRAKAIATKAASADLGGDPKFSGWAPTLETRFDHIGPGAIVLHPTKRSAGPWTVAEFGRNQMAGPRMTGPRLTRTGRVSKAKGTRWNGRTQGKGTATDALKMIESEMPKIIDVEVAKAVRSIFR